MGFDGVGWLAAIIIGGIAGWLAQKVMNTNTGLLMNIVLGISFGGWIDYLIAGFIGACILIAIVRAVKR